MSFEVFTHVLHGHGPLAPSFASSFSTSLLSACGRIVAAAHGTRVELFDSHDVSELSRVFGAGACKMRFLCAISVTDISDPVTVQAVHFLRGGHLAVAGVCKKGTGERGAVGKTRAFEECALRARSI